jgi:hypothetical protein
MNKFTYVWKIVKDRWIRPYDDIILRFNTKAKEGDPLVWRIFINGVENLASSFEVQGYIYDIISYEHDVKKYNVGCRGRVRWDGTKAVIITAQKEPDIAL